MKGRTAAATWRAFDRASSVLKVETFRCLEESTDMDEFLRANTGRCSALMFPTMLGLRLAEDFQLGTRYCVLFCSALMFPTMLGLRLAEDFQLGTRY